MYAGSAPGLTSIVTLTAQVSDYDALMDLYNSTGGEDWTNNAGWSGDGEVCSWQHVTCVDSKVVELKVPYEHPCLHVQPARDKGLWPLRDSAIERCTH